MPAVDFVQLALEESPVYDGAPAAAPYRVSTDVLYLPARSARIAPSPLHLDRADELRGVPGAPPRLIDGFEPVGNLSVRAYAKLLTWLLELAGFQGTVTAGGATVTGPEQTTVTGANALNSVTITVADTSRFAASGTIIIAGAAVTYTGKTATSFTGCGAHAAYSGGEIVNDNVPVGASKWVFSKREAINAQTAQIVINYARQAMKYVGNGYGVSNLTLNAMGEAAADMMGLVCKRATVDAATVPAYPSMSIPPFRRRELYIADLAGGGRIADWNIGISNPLERIFGLGLAVPTPFPDALEHGDDQVQVTGAIPKRVMDADDFDAIVNASTFAAKASFSSAVTIGATSYPYKLVVDMPACQYVSGQPGEMGNRRRFGMDDVGFFAAYSEAAGYDARLTLVNDVPAIRTFV